MMWKSVALRMRRIRQGAIAVAQRLAPDSAAKPPWERSVLEDIAARRPWNLRVKAERVFALARIRDLREGVTVVIVNWNTKDVTSDVIRAVQTLSPTGTNILLVNNGSTDGSREHFRTVKGIQTLFLGGNAGHGAALDIALSRVRTRTAVTLDSDAIPLRPDWLTPAVQPVAEGRAVLAGHRSSRAFVHPVYAAVNTREFLRRRLSFQIFVPPGVDPSTAVWGEEAWDTGEIMTRRLGEDEVVFVESGEVPVPGLRGGMTKDVVYHYGGLIRETTGALTAEAVAEWRRSHELVLAALDVRSAE